MSVLLFYLFTIRAHYLARFVQIIHSVLACRMMLRLRDYGRRSILSGGFADCATDLSIDGATVAVDSPLSFANGRSLEIDIESSACSRAIDNNDNRI